MHEQLLRGLRVELRVSAQELQERRELALKAGLPHRRDHLRVQAADLGHAERVDGRGLHVERGELADLGAVVGLAVGQGLGGERRAHARHILLAHELQQPHIGRLHRVADHPERPLAQRLLLLRRNARHLS